MIKTLKIILLVLTATACRDSTTIEKINTVDWKNRTVDLPSNSLLENGSTYLSIYSQIYSQTQHTLHNLTVTVSMRNVSKTDTVYINRGQYFDTKGNLLESYVNETIFLGPMETIEIIIDEHNQKGGTGANFIFDWSKKSKSNDPYFEGVMISTSGQQGLSFITIGVKTN